MDFSGCVVKSDNIISNELQNDIQNASLILDSVHQKNSRLDSDGQVHDLVDPSLYPLVYGVTKILPQSKIGLADSLRNIAKGITVEKQVETEPDLDSNELKLFRNFEKYFSYRFQWLPSNVVFEDEGKTRIDSYVNNLNPYEHKEVYSLLEKVIDASIPMWNETL